MGLPVTVSVDAPLLRELRRQRDAQEGIRAALERVANALDGVDEQPALDALTARIRASNDALAAAVAAIIPPTP